jgi:hypothetical protein
MFSARAGWTARDEETEHAQLMNTNFSVAILFKISLPSIVRGTFPLLVTTTFDAMLGNCKYGLS